MTKNTKGVRGDRKEHATDVSHGSTPLSTRGVKSKNGSPLFLSASFIIPWESIRTEKDSISGLISSLHSLALPKATVKNIRVYSINGNN